MVVALVWAAVRFRTRLRELVPPLVRPVAVCIGVTSALLAYPIWMMLAGPQHFTGHPWPVHNPWHNDILSFVVPGPLQRTTFGLGAVGTRLASPVGVTEAGGYIGIPLLLLGGWLAYRSRRSSRMQLVIVLFLAAALLSLGPNLAIDGRTTSIPLPFLVLDHLPLINDLLPIRISFEMDGLFAAIIAFGLDDLRRATGSDRSTRRHVRDRAAVVAAATLVVVVVTLLPRWPAGPAYAAPRAGPFRPPSRDIPKGDPSPSPIPTTSTTPCSAVRYATHGLAGPVRFQLPASRRFCLPSERRWLPTLLPRTCDRSICTDFLTSNEGFSPMTHRERTSVAVTPALVKTTRLTTGEVPRELFLVDRSMPGSRAVVDPVRRRVGTSSVVVGQFTLWSS